MEANIYNNSNAGWREVQNDDKDAFDKLYHYHVDALFNYGSKLTRDNQLIEDAIQDVFISLWNGRKKLTVKTTIRGYLLSSVRRQVIFLLKKKDNTRDFLPKFLQKFQSKKKKQANYKQGMS